MVLWETLHEGVSVSVKLEHSHLNDLTDTDSDLYWFCIFLYRVPG